MGSIIPYITQPTRFFSLIMPSFRYKHNFALFPFPPTSASWPWKCIWARWWAVEVGWVKVLYHERNHMFIDLVNGLSDWKNQSSTASWAAHFCQYGTKRNAAAVFRMLRFNQHSMNPTMVDLPTGKHLFNQSISNFSLEVKERLTLPRTLITNTP